jgi:penicillin-binding protein 2
VVKKATWTGIIVLILAIISPVWLLAQAVRGASTPEAAARMFLDAWAQENFSAMYETVHPRSREIYPFQVFENRYVVAHRNMGFTGLAYTIHDVVTQGESAVVTYDVTIESPAFGTVADPGREMRLVRGDEGWLVAWSPLDILDGLASEIRLTVTNDFEPRANVYDRDGVPLVQQDGTIYYLVGTQQDMANVDDCIDLIARLTLRQRNSVTRQFQDYLPETRFRIGEIDPALFEANRDALANVCGINATDDNNNDVGAYTSRSYRDHGAATHVTGYIGRIPTEELAMWQSQGYTESDVVGRAGIERSFQGILAGTPERSLQMIEPGGTVIRELGGTLGAAPQPVQLTIDADLQRTTAQAIADAFSYAQPNWAGIANGAAVVVLDVNTGEILALASYPSFDPSLFNPDTSYDSTFLQRVLADPRGPLANKAVQEQYSPGSVYKIITLVAAAAEGLFTPDQLFSCGLEWSGVAEYNDELAVRYDWRYTDELDAAGEITMAEALTASCNPFFWEVGGMLFERDPDLLARYSEMLGLGRPTGLTDLGTEASGSVAHPTRAAEAINNAIGQGDISVSALQMANVVATIANGGTLHEPSIIRQIGGFDGTEIQRSSEPAEGQVLDIDPEVWAIVREGMCGVTTDRDLGTAYFVFNGTPYTVCGKTGTAQTGGAPHAWFVAFAPADDPQIAIAAVVPNSREGSEVAAPIVRRILDGYFGARAAAFPEWWEGEYVPVAVPEGGTAGG